MVVPLAGSSGAIGQDMISGMGLILTRTTQGSTPPCSSPHEPGLSLNNTHGSTPHRYLHKLSQSVKCYRGGWKFCLIQSVCEKMVPLCSVYQPSSCYMLPLKWSIDEENRHHIVRMIVYGQINSRLAAAWIIPYSAKKVPGDILIIGWVVANETQKLGAHFFLKQARVLSLYGKLLGFRQDITRQVREIISQSERSKLSLY